MEDNVICNSREFKYSIDKGSIFTNVYGLARSLLSLSTLSVLVSTKISELVPENYYNIIINYPQSRFNIFFLFDYHHIYIPVVISSLILVITTVGVLPQITGILHFWVTFSTFNIVVAPEGGDQIASIITAFLTPVTIFDKRLSHWDHANYFRYVTPEFIKYFCYSCIVVIQVQIAILYFDAGVEKLKVNEWVDGTATYYWFNHTVFGAPDWMRLLFGQLFVYSLTVTLITWGVIIFEILLFAAFFMKQEYKYIFFVLGLCFHFIIFLTHGLPSFGLAMSGALVIYLIPSTKFLRL